MVGMKKYPFLCCVLSIALVLSPCAIVLNPWNKVLATPPDCTDEEQEYDEAKEAFDESVKELAKAKEALKKALEVLEKAIEEREKAEEDLKKAEQAYADILVVVYNAQKTYDELVEDLTVLAVAHAAACGSCILFPSIPTCASCTALTIALAELYDDCENAKDALEAAKQQQLDLSIALKAAKQTLANKKQAEKNAKIAADIAELWCEYWKLICKDLLKEVQNKLLLLTQCLQGK